MASPLFLSDRSAAGLAAASHARFHRPSLPIPPRPEIVAVSGLPGREYWSLAAFYGFFFASLGVWVPYWPLYLKELGLNAEEIGLIFAAGLGIRALGTPVWGRWADLHSRHGVTLITVWLALLLFTLFYGVERFWPLLGVTAAYSLFHSGPLALTEATAMEVTVRRGGDYGRVRVWGSMGFVAAVLAMGPLIDLWGVDATLHAMTAMLLGMAGTALFLPHPARRDAPSRGRGAGGSLFARPAVRWFFLSVMLMQFSHAGYYGFFSLRLQSAGYSETVIGLLWSLGVAAEIVFMRYSRGWMARFGGDRLMVWSLGLAAGRWVILAAVVWWPVVALSQLLHAFTFGAFHLGAVRRTHEAASEENRGVAQAWYASLSHGVGGGLGMVLSGVLYHRWGAEALFGVMAAAAAAGLAVGIKAMRLFQEPPAAFHGTQRGPGREEGAG
ncbi:MAG: MFS transporter [Magnetococcales bacterium]|nr:MFS transporter [Magnetococcales bacterium]